MTIVITLPDFIDGEAEQIANLLIYGKADIVHLRKPRCESCELEELIKSIPTELYGRLVLHDHHELAVKYGLFGIHLNSRNPVAPEVWKGSVSRSCHSLSEVIEWKERCNYVSLSPIFDSISKKGYISAFSTEEIADAVREGIIDSKVLALGGVTFDRLKEVEMMGFGGGIILGDAWRKLQNSKSR